MAATEIEVNYRRLDRELFSHAGNHYTCISRHPADGALLMALGCTTSFQPSMENFLRGCVLCELFLRSHKSVLGFWRFELGIQHNPPVAGLIELHLTPQEHCCNLVCTRMLRAHSTLIVNDRRSGLLHRRQTPGALQCENLKDDALWSAISLIVRCENVCKFTSKAYGATNVKR